MADKIYMNYIYPSSLLRQLSDLWKSEQMCDAVITVDKVIVAKAHKLLLLAVSAKLKSDSNSSSQTAFLEVNLPSGLQHKSVHAFLQYLYEGFLLLSKEMVADMIRIAEFLDIECLLGCCQEYKKTLTLSDKSDSEESSSLGGFQKEFKHVRSTVTKENTEEDKRSSDNTECDSNSKASKRRRHSNDLSDSCSLSKKSSRNSVPYAHHGQDNSFLTEVKSEPTDRDSSERENMSVSQDSTYASSHSLPTKSPNTNVISKDTSISFVDDDIIEIKEEPDDEDFSIIESSFSNMPQNYPAEYSNTFQQQGTPISSSGQVTPSMMSRQSSSDIDYLTQSLNQDQQEQYQDDGGTQDSYGPYDPSDGQVPGTSGSFSQEEADKSLQLQAYLSGLLPHPPTNASDRKNKEILCRERVRGVVECRNCRKPRCVYSMKRMVSKQEDVLNEVKVNNSFVCGSEIEVRGAPELITRHSLNCDSPIEMAYYGCTYTSFPPCCYYCGTYTSLLQRSHPYIEHLLNLYSSVKPLCEACHACKKPAKTHGQKINKLYAIQPFVKKGPQRKSQI